jgi:hypothetical protein
MTILRKNGKMFRILKKEAFGSLGTTKNITEENI